MLKKSIVIAGRHQTSISVEPEFYAALENIAQEQNLSINALITQIDSLRNESYNLSSAVRVYILNYFQKKSSDKQNTLSF
ncbi:MAG: ribbon-helix-helix domain-containing protein [Azospirillum sp.]|nr:ribbon-helix-helix domain-containing protein [Azospirillum sp.]